jgi:hypothetical protein
MDSPNGLGLGNSQNLLMSRSTFDELASALAACSRSRAPSPSPSAEPETESDGLHRVPCRRSREECACCPVWVDVKGKLEGKLDLAAKVCSNFLFPTFQGKKEGGLLSSSSSLTSAFRCSYLGRTSSFGETRSLRKEPRGGYQQCTSIEHFQNRLQSLIKNTGGGPSNPTPPTGRSAQ